MKIRAELVRIIEVIYMKISEIVFNSVVCTADEHVPEIIKMMTDNDLDYLPVVESIAHKNPIGVVTEKSICRRSIAKGLNPLKLTAGRVMDTHFKIVDPEMSLEDCLFFIKSSDLKYVVVSDENNKFCGLLTLAELSKRINEQKPVFIPGEINKLTGQIQTYDRIY